ncbi:MAG: hypothetical protein ACFCGT_21815 [Sandaracinaceae bacterium]
MLPPFIIEQIRKREEDERRRGESPVLPLHLPDAPIAPAGDDDAPDRGVVIIDLG